MTEESRPLQIPPAQYGLMREPMAEMEHDHPPTMADVPDFAIPTFSLGTAHAVGTARTIVRSDATIFYPPTSWEQYQLKTEVTVTPGSTASADTPWVVNSTYYHGTPGNGFSLAVSDTSIKVTNAGIYLVVAWLNPVLSGAPTSGYVFCSGILKASTPNTLRHAVASCYMPYTAVITSPEPMVSLSAIFNLSANGQLELTYSVYNALDAGNMVMLTSGATGASLKIMRLL